MNRSNNNSSFKTTWAGLDAKIHSPKPSWSVGNFNLIRTDQQAGNRPNNIKTIQKDKLFENISPQHKWLLLHYLLKMLGK